MNIQTKYNIGDKVLLLTNDMPRQGVIEEINTSVEKDGIVRTWYSVLMADTNRPTIVHEESLRDDERSVLLDMAEQLEAKAKAYRDKAGIVQ